MSLPIAKYSKNQPEKKEDDSSKDLKKVLKELYADYKKSNNKDEKLNKLDQMLKMFHGKEWQLKKYIEHMDNDNDLEANFFATYVYDTPKEIK